jgi:hypothetical protein
MRMEWRGEAVLAKVKGAIDDGLNDSAEIVSKEWQKTIPYATGELASHVQPVKTGDLEYSVSSTGPYARRQELDESLRHPDPTNPASRSGRKVHAGRDALEDNRDNIEKLVASRVQGVL